MGTEYIRALVTNSQPTASAEIVLAADVTEEDAPPYEVQNMITDHLPVGGVQLGCEAVHDQYCLVAKHDPKTNIITISWARPEDIIEYDNPSSKGEVFEQLHPSLREEFQDWEDDWTDFEPYEDEE